MQNVSPYIRIARYDIQEQYFCFDRTIWDYELIYIEEGTMKVCVENNTYICSKGDIILLRPGIHHILESQGIKVIQPHVHFDLIQDELSPRIFVSFVNRQKMSEEQKKWFRKDILPDLDINLPDVFRIPNNTTVRDILYELIDEFNYKRPYSGLVMKSLLIKILTTISRSYDEKINETLFGSHKNDIDELAKFIKEHIDENLTLDMLSQHVNISKFYLSRIFKAVYGKSPHRYISELRYKRAKDLVQFSNLSFYEISIKMNFADQQTFSRWFKAIDGFPPSKYRIK